MVPLLGTGVPDRPPVGASPEAGVSEVPVAFSRVRHRRLGCIRCTSGLFQRVAAVRAAIIHAGRVAQTAAAAHQDFSVGNGLAAVGRAAAGRTWSGDGGRLPPVAATSPAVSAMIVFPFPCFFFATPRCARCHRCWASPRRPRRRCRGQLPRPSRQHQNHRPWLQGFRGYCPPSGWGQLGRLGLGLPGIGISLSLMPWGASANSRTRRSFTSSV